LLRLSIIAVHAIGLDKDGIGCGVWGDRELLGELSEEDRDAAVAAATDKGGEEGVERERGDGGREGRRSGAKGVDGLLGEVGGGVAAQDGGEVGLGVGRGEMGGEEGLRFSEAAGEGKAARRQGERVPGGGSGDGRRVDGVEDGDHAVRIALAAELPLGVRERRGAGVGAAGGGGERTGEAAAVGVGAAAVAEERRERSHFRGRRRDEGNWGEEGFVRVFFARFCDL